MKNQKIRTIVTQDAEVDDQNSLRHFLLYSNEVEVQGIVQTASKFHWIGVPGAATPEVESGDAFGPRQKPAPYDRPYRFTGTEWMFQELDQYEQVLPMLRIQDPSYPDADALRAVTKVGNIGYPGETEKATEGSDLIKERILDDDPRRLYIQVWGGCNTIARALMDIEAEYGSSASYEEMRQKIMHKVVLTACGEQDNSYRDYIAEKWPDIAFVRTLQIGSYAYAWHTMPEGNSQQTLEAEFMRNILEGNGSLMADYCTWGDGHHYEGEPPECQFGDNPALFREWFGVKLMGMAPYKPYDFLSEGDSPTFLCLMPFGFHNLEDFSYGGISGRYVRDLDQHNSKGQPLNYWNVTEEDYLCRDGSLKKTESMWRYVADIQNDFAARANWCSAGSREAAEHAPLVRIREGRDIAAAPGQTITLHAEGTSPDGREVHYSFRICREASNMTGADALADRQMQALQEGLRNDSIDPNMGQAGDSFRITIPENAQPGERILIQLRGETRGKFVLASYDQVILTVSCHFDVFRTGH